MFESTVSTKHRWKDLLFRFIESRQTLIRPFPPLLLRKINKQTNNANNKNKLKKLPLCKMTQQFNDIRVHHSLPLSLLLPRFCCCFILCWAFTRLHFGWKNLGENFYDFRIRWNKVQEGSGTRFSLEFSGQLYVSLFFLPFCPTCLTESWSFAHNMRDVKSCLWQLKPITSQAVQGVVGLHGRFRGEWISRLTTSFHDLCPYSRKKWRRNVENSSGTTSRRRVVSTQSVENFDVISTVHKTRLIVGSLDTKDHR